MHCIVHIVYGYGEWVKCYGNKKYCTEYSFNLKYCTEFDLSWWNTVNNPATKYNVLV